MVQMKVTGNRQLMVGDFIAKAGIYTKPGVVTEKRENGTLAIDTSPEAIQKYHRHSNTSGMSVENKERFNSIMDNVMGMEKNSDRVSALENQIEELKSSPENKKMIDSLKNEQAQLIRMSRELPRVYSVDQNDLRY